MNIYSIFTKAFRWGIYACIYIIPYLMVKYSVLGKKRKPQTREEYIWLYLESIGGTAFTMGMLFLFATICDSDKEFDSQNPPIEWSNLFALQFIGVIVSVFTTYKYEKLIKGF